MIRYILFRVCYIALYCFIKIMNCTYSKLSRFTYFNIIKICSFSIFQHFHRQIKLFIPSLCSCVPFFILVFFGISFHFPQKTCQRFNHCILHFLKCPSHTSCPDCTSRWYSAEAQQCVCMVRQPAQSLPAPCECLPE